MQSEDFIKSLDEMLKSQGIAWIAVTGRSMFPTLQEERDFVCLRRCTPADFRRGIILLYRRKDGTIVLHRVRKVLPNGMLLMNGDAQAWCEQIEQKQVVAVAGEMIRKGKRMDCRSVKLCLWDMWWYSTRPFRPLIKKVFGSLKGHRKLF